MYNPFVCPSVRIHTPRTRDPDEKIFIEGNVTSTVIYSRAEHKTANLLIGRWQPD